MLSKIAKLDGLDVPKPNKVQNFLANITSIGIGRTLVDYSELTAKDVMLTGLNVEYNPSYYAAFAAGAIDFGFRDLLGNNRVRSKQYLTLGRIGWGNTEKRSVILTVFNGQKSDYTTLNGADNTSSKIFGYALETRVRKNENTSFSIEVAKSTKTSRNLLGRDSVKANNLFNYGDHSNLGINIKGETLIPETNTKLSGFFRQTGSEFQSFSAFTFNTGQQAWQARIDQILWKNKVNLTAMMRQNDFVSPFTENTFKTSTIFKTFQASINVPRWPVLNIGYYPGSQFYIVDKNTIRENVYYILNGSLLYSYSYKSIKMNTAFAYNKFFNQSTDTGFVFYSGVNYTINQSVFLKNVQLQGGFAYNAQQEINFTSYNAEGDYNMGKRFRLGAGLKYNNVLGGEGYLGKSARLGADFKQLGIFQLSYEKSYLPTLQRNLFPVESGRISWYKFF
jgi:hypothetical protein